MRPTRWTWRSRWRDPRFVGVVVAGLEGGLAIGILRRSDGDWWIAPLLAVVVCAVTAVTALPPWSDPKHSARAGALAVALTGLSVLLIAVIAAMAFGAWH